MMKRALLVAVSAGNNPLSGAAATMGLLKRFLQKEAGFAPAEIRTLGAGAAKSQAILDQIDQWLLNGAGPGSRLVFALSAHGFILGGEQRFSTHDGALREAELSAFWQRPLPGRRLTCVYDACRETAHYLLLEELKRAARPLAFPKIPPVPRITEIPGQDWIGLKGCITGGRGGYNSQVAGRGPANLGDFTTALLQAAVQLPSVRLAAQRAYDLMPNPSSNLVQVPDITGARELLDARIFLGP